MAIQIIDRIDIDTFNHQARFYVYTERKILLKYLKI